MEVLGHLFLIEFLFDSVNNCHDSLDVFVENVTFLQALVRDKFLWLFIVRLVEIVLDYDCVVCNVVHYVVSFGLVLAVRA